MRALVAALLLANALFFAWSQSWLDGVAGARAHGDREPERLAQQVRPDAVRVLSPAEVRQAEQAAAVQALAASAVATSASASAASAPLGSAASAPGNAASGAGNAVAAAGSAPSRLCLESGPFDDTAFAAAQAALRQALPTVRWTDVRTSIGGAWIVYMGKYPNREMQTRKEAELRRIRVTFEEVNAPGELSPGLSLGRFDTRIGADAALAQFTRRGIRTARVVELQPGVPAHLLRVETVDPAVAARLAALPAASGERRFAACRVG